MSKTVVKPLPRVEFSSGPGRGNLPPSGGGKFDPKAFAKTLTAEQQKDFRSLGKNTGGNYLGWGKNAATGAGMQASPEEMLRRRYANKPAAKTPPTGEKTIGIPPIAAPATGTTSAPAAAATTASAPMSGGPVVSPSSSSAAMASMSSGGGGGDMGMGGGGGGMQAMNGMSRFRQGIGQRMPPVQSASLAALRKIY